LKTNFNDFGLSEDIRHLSPEAEEIKRKDEIEQATRPEDSEHTKKLLHELLNIKQQNNGLQRNFEYLKRDTDNEIRTLRNELFDSRFKVQVRV
jgi:ribosomal protein L29